TQPRERLFGPVLRGPFGTDAEIKAFGRDEHAVGVLETAHADAVEPDRERIAESGARLLGRADEIGDHRTSRLRDPVTDPSHAARVLDAVVVAEAEIA